MINSKPVDLIPFKMRYIDNKIIKNIKKNWYLSVIIESLNPPLNIYAKQIVKVILEEIHKGISDIKFNKNAIAVISAIRKIIK